MGGAGALSLLSCAGMRRSLLPTLFAALVLAACDQNRPDPVSPDAGGTSRDGGGFVDSGTPADGGGHVDGGGFVDSGTPADGGGHVDGGTVTDTDGGVDGGTVTPPPLETRQCPAPDTSEVGTNTVIRLHSSSPIAPETVSPSSLRAFINQEELPGTLGIAGQDLTFVPETPLPPQQLVQVTLSADVLDTHGRSLATDGGTWTFLTADGPTSVPGFVYSPPKSPPRGSHAPRHTLAMDGERALLAWSTARELLVTASDGTSFQPPLTLYSGLFGEQLSLAVGGGSVHLGWAYFNGPGTIAYSRADLSLSSPPAPSVGLSPASHVPKLTASPKGELAMVWDVHSDYWDPIGGRLTTSPDNGETFTDLSLIEFGASSPNVLFSDGRLVLAWRRSPPGENSLHLAISEDQGRSFSPPVMLANSRLQLWPPQLVDTHTGEVLVLWQEGFALSDTGRSTWMRSLSLDSGTLGEPMQVIPPHEANACSTLVSSPTGKLALVHSRGHAFKNDWVTEVRTSEDHGRTFGPPSVVEVIDPIDGCPSVGYAPSGGLYLAWTRGDFELVLSRGRPKRPCE